MNREEIKVIIRNAIIQVTGLDNLDGKTSLISKELGIMPVNFLYIFEILKNELELPVYKIFENHTYQVMTIDNLANAFMELA